MPHISKRKVSSKTREESSALLMALLAEASASARKQILQELFTDTEKIMLAKRLSIIYLISKHTSTREISNILGVSLSTVSRFECTIERGGYRKTAQWVRMMKVASPLWKLIEKVAAIPFDAQKKSLAQLSKDW